VSDNPARKTRCDLVAVKKGDLFINMDSQAPNQAAREALPRLIPGLTKIKPEASFGQSRLDFYAEAGERRIFLEVKGVTLEENGEALFPDAPTERGVKHVRELIHCHEEGFETYVLFVVQMERALYFTPNRKTHPQFADALCEAQNAGVHLLAYTCKVTPDEMTIDKELKISL
jgi:sugar fermentation stimulation protein A